MSYLKITVAGRIPIAFGSVTLSFLRGVMSSQTGTMDYSNGTGQTVAAGQELYSIGTRGEPNYISVKALNATTFIGSGYFPVSVEHYPSEVQAPQSVNFNFDNNPIVINLNYNSAPTTNDIVINLENRQNYDFSLSDFSTKYSDFDGDALAEVALFGDVTGYLLGEDPYIAGTWLNALSVADLSYKSLDQNAEYEKSVVWKAKDNQGNISV